MIEEQRRINTLHGLYRKMLKQGGKIRYIKNNEKDEFIIGITFERVNMGIDRFGGLSLLYQEECDAIYLLKPRHDKPTNR